MNKSLSVILISFVGIVAYSNTFHCSFYLDDAPSITDNFAIRNIHDLQSIWNFWPCRFITYLSLAFNYHLNGLRVPGYHLFNVMVHVMTAILVWWLALLTLSTPAMKKGGADGKDDLIALFAGLIFVSHPVQTQAVTYIVQRAASMATLFYMASLCFYVKSRLKTTSTPGVAVVYYACSLLTAVLAMFTKEMAITLPLMVLLYEFSFLKTRQGFNWKVLTPFLLTLLIIPVTTVLTRSFDLHGMQRVGEEATNISSFQYLLTQFRVMVTYIRLLFLPLGQNLDYDYPVFKSLFELPVLASFLFLIAVLFVAQRSFSRYRLVAFSIFWFFLTLLPESSFLPIKDVIFEHRLYLPLVGYSLLLASGIYYCFGDTLKGVPKKSKYGVPTMCIVLTLIVACNTVLTYQRNKVWKNEFTLWDDTVRKSPHKSRPHNGRGRAYYDQGDFIKALADYDQAIEINPGNKEAYNNRGVIYSKQNNFSRAMSDYDRAIELNPGYAEVYINRGLTYDKEGKFARAMADYNKAIQLDPLNAGARAIELDPEFYYNQGSLYDKQGHFSQAIRDYSKAIEIDPRHAKAYNNRGDIYAKQNDLTRALSDFNKAIELNPHYAETYYNRGTLYAKQGDLTRALSDFDRAIEIKPDYAQSYYNRGIIRAKQGDLLGAASNFNKAIEIKPDYAEAYNNRSFIDGIQGNFTRAMSDCNKAIEIKPDYAEAYLNRAATFYQLKEYDKAWRDVHKAEGSGATVNPNLINMLKESSGQDH